MILWRLVAEKKVGLLALRMQWEKKNKRQQYFGHGIHPGEMADFEPILRTGSAMGAGNLPSELRTVKRGVREVFAVSDNWRHHNKTFDAVETEVVTFSA